MIISSHGNWFGATIMLLQKLTSMPMIPIVPDMLFGCPSVSSNNTHNNWGGGISFHTNLRLIIYNCFYAHLKKQIKQVFQLFFALKLQFVLNQEAFQCFPFISFFCLLWLLFLLCCCRELWISPTVGFKKRKKKGKRSYYPLLELSRAFKHSEM